MNRIANLAVAFGSRLLLAAFTATASKASAVSPPLVGALLSKATGWESQLDKQG